MTKADLLAAIAHLPDTAEIRIAADGGETPAEVILRAPGPEIWLGDRAALADELDAYNTHDPEKADSILWHNPQARCRSHRPHLSKTTILIPPLFTPK